MEGLWCESGNHWTAGNKIGKILIGHRWKQYVCSLTKKVHSSQAFSCEFCKETSEQLLCADNFM